MRAFDPLLMRGADYAAEQALTSAFYILQILQIGERTNSREDTFHLGENSPLVPLGLLGKPSISHGDFSIKSTEDL